MLKIMIRGHMFITEWGTGGGRGGWYYLNTWLYKSSPHPSHTTQSPPPPSHTILPTVLECLSLCSSIVSGRSFHSTTVSSNWYPPTRNNIAATPCGHHPHPGQSSFWRCRRGGFCLWGGRKRKSRWKASRPR